MRQVLVVLAIAAAAVVGTRGAQSLKAVVGPYLEIQAALAADRTEGISAAASKISVQAAAMGAPGEAIAKAAKAVEGAADLEAARTAFGELSDAVIAATKGDPSAAADLKVAYCPMAKKSWLQKDDKIRNPYYGSSMLGCGEFKR